MKTAPYLPTNILFRASKSLVKRADKQLQFIANWKELEEREADLNRTEAEYRDRFLGGEYSVLEYTNHNNLTIPARFCLQRFLPNRGLFEEYHGVVTKVRAPSIASFVPKLDRGTAVLDGRFRDISAAVNGIRYTITNGAWPSFNDKALADIFSRTPRNVLRSRSQERLPMRLVFTVAIALLIIAPAAVMLGHAAHSHSSKQYKLH